MNETSSILIVVLVVIFILSPFGLGEFFFKWILQWLFYLLISPYYIWLWLKECLAIGRRRRNYELLGRYIALMGNNPDNIKYFRQLVELGIKEKELESLLDANVENARNIKATEQQQELQQKTEEEEQIKKLALEQQEMLMQSRVSLEQIKFREKLLDELYQKIKKKYKI
jgi:hypothetical protein